MIFFKKTNYFSKVLFIFCFVCLRSASSVLSTCPKVSFMNDFNVTLFTGRWYEIERSFYLMEIISSCVSVDLVMNPKRNLQVTVSTKNRWTGKISLSEGIAVQSKRDPSIFLYRVNSKLPRFLAKFLPGAGYYQVVDTDYEQYAILYSCSNLYLTHTDLIWVWAREMEIEADLRAKIYDILRDHQLDSERVYLPKNSNCSDY